MLPTYCTIFLISPNYSPICASPSFARNTSTMFVVVFLVAIIASSFVDGVEAFHNYGLCGLCGLGGGHHHLDGRIRRRRPSHPPSLPPPPTGINMTTAVMSAAATVTGTVAARPATTETTAVATTAVATKPASNNNANPRPNVQAHPRKANLIFFFPLNVLSIGRSISIQR